MSIQSQIMCDVPYANEPNFEAVVRNLDDVQMGVVLCLLVREGHRAYT